MTTALQSLTSKLAARLEMGDGSGLIDTLKATAFKGQVTDAQMTALMVVANQYALNPWTKEIYAFPDKNNGIVPVVGVDGWSRIINSNDKFDGMEFEQDDEKCTCIIFRKDRSHPIKVTEYMSECKRPNVGPWQSHPKRMLRHKAMIQCARIAFGFGGIYDQDEAERIVETEPRGEKVVTGEVIKEPYSAADFAKNLPKWRELVSAGKKTGAQIVAMVNSKAPLTEEQTATLMALRVTPPANVEHETGEVLDEAAKVRKAIESAKDLDLLQVACDLVASLPKEQQGPLYELYRQRAAELAG